MSGVNVYNSFHKMSSRPKWHWTRWLAKNALSPRKEPAFLLIIKEYIVLFMIYISWPYLIQLKSWLNYLVIHELTLLKCRSSECRYSRFYLRWNWPFWRHSALVSLCIACLNVKLHRGNWKKQRYDWIDEKWWSDCMTQTRTRCLFGLWMWEKEQDPINWRYCVFLRWAVTPWKLVGCAS